MNTNLQVYNFIRKFADSDVFAHYDCLQKNSLLEPACRPEAKGKMKKRIHREYIIKFLKKLGKKTGRGQA